MFIFYSGQLQFTEEEQEEEEQEQEQEEEQQQEQQQHLAIKKTSIPLNTYVFMVFRL